MIDIAGEVFYDLDEILLLNHADPPRPYTNGLALHHSATVFTSNVAENEYAYIRSVEKYHVMPAPGGAGFGMFGYNAMAFPSGRVYVKGQCAGKRAHVGGHNHEYAGICMAGDYSTLRPSQPMIGGVARWVRAMRRLHGDVPLRPHGDVTAGTQWSSTCPGQGGRVALAAIDMLAAEPAEEEHEMTDEEFRAKLAEILTPYQSAVEAYMHNLNMRLIAEEQEHPEAGDPALRAEIDEIKRRLDEASAALKP